MVYLANADVIRLVGNMLISAGCIMHLVGSLRYFTARSDMPFRVKILASILFFGGAFAVTTWDTVEILFIGIGPWSATVRLLAGIAIIGTGVASLDKRHVEYYKRLRTQEQSSSDMAEITRLMNELREERDE
jgi:hypothetical protein